MESRRGTGENRKGEVVIIGRLCGVNVSSV